MMENPALRSRNMNRDFSICLMSHNIDFKTLGLC